MDIQKSLEVLSDIEKIGLNIIAVKGKGKESLELLMNLVAMLKAEGSVLEKMDKLIEIVKDLDVGASVLNELIDLAANLQEIVKDGSAVLPELKDLDADESAQLGKKAYEVLSNLCKACCG